LKRPIATTLVACLAAACNTIQPQPPPVNGAMTVDLPKTEFPGANTMAAGFDERIADQSWEMDDEVVFALRLRRGEQVDRWLLRLSVMLGERLTGSLDSEPLTKGIGLWEEMSWTYTITDHGERRDAQVKSKLLPVVATVCDEQGRKLTTSVVKLPVRLLGRGVLPAIDCALAATQAQAQATPGEPAREVSLQPLVEATIGLMSLLNVVQEDDALADYFWQVVEKPSLWSIITGFGVKATFSMGFEKSVPAASLPPDLPAANRAFVVPMQIDVNGSPALFLELTATDAARPYSLCGGIVGGVARHPTKADYALELQLIAARLGKAKPVKFTSKPGPEPKSRDGGPPSFAGTKGGDEREVAGVKLCWCPPGHFLMGSPPHEPERRPGEDQVEVNLGGFWIAKYEATQAQWQRVVGALPGPLTAQLPAGDDLPVGNVNFAEAEAFCQKLTELGHSSGELPRDWEFRLPTEAQWEYACRAGTTTATHFGDQLSSKQANFKGKPYAGAEEGPSLGRAQKVGSYPANAWGLHDMHGNIYEWCRDWYQARLPGGTDPDLYSAKDTATPSGNGALSRVRRGGCWCDDGWALRTAFRLRFEPERRYDHIGFRVAVVRP